MADAASPLLNQLPRSEQQAHDTRVKVEQERRERLALHGGDFCNRVLAGAFERVYRHDGSFRLREIQTGVWVEDLPPNGVADSCGLPSSTQASPTPRSELRLEPQSAAMTPGSPATMIEAAQRTGYALALRELAHWISAAATKPRMDTMTLAALNAQITRMSGCERTAKPMATTRKGP